jgi:hypothetical protein
MTTQDQNDILHEHVYASEVETFVLQKISKEKQSRLLRLGTCILLSLLLIKERTQTFLCPPREVYTAQFQPSDQPQLIQSNDPYYLDGRSRRSKDVIDPVNQQTMVCQISTAGVHASRNPTNLRLITEFVGNQSITVILGS